MSISSTTETLLLLSAIPIAFSLNSKATDANSLGLSLGSIPSPKREKGPIRFLATPDASAALSSPPIVLLFEAKFFAFFMRRFFLAAFSQDLSTLDLTSSKFLCRVLVSLFIRTIKYPPSSLSNNWLS